MEGKEGGERKRRKRGVDVSVVDSDDVGVGVGDVGAGMGDVGVDVGDMSL